MFLIDKMQLKKLKCRHMTCLSLFLCLASCYFFRSFISVAVLSMGKITDAGDTSSTKKLEFTPRLEFTLNQQGFIIGSYFYGYFCTNFIGVFPIRMFGPRNTMIICLFGSILFTFLLPPFTYVKGHEFALILVCRIGTGIFCGPLYCCINELLARWCPKDERSTLAVLTHSGNIFGLILAFSTGALSDLSLNAWQGYTYFGGCFGLVSLVLWWFFVFDYAWEHPRISQEEVKLIETSLYSNGRPVKGSFSEIPFRSMFTSFAVYINSLAHFANNFIIYMFLTGHPKYLKNVYHFTPKAASLITLIPFSVNFIAQFFSAKFTQILIRKFPMRNITFVRKINGAIAFFFSFIFMVCAGFTSSAAGAVTLLSLGIAAIAFNQPAFFTALIEIAPSFSSYVMGISNTIASIAGFLNPLMVAKFEENNRDDPHCAWKNAFLSTAGVSLFLGIIWLLFGTSELQPWDKSMKQITDGSSLKKYKKDEMDKKELEDKPAQIELDISENQEKEDSEKDNENMVSIPID